MATPRRRTSSGFDSPPKSSEESLKTFPEKEEATPEKEQPEVVLEKEPEPELKVEVETPVEIMEEIVATDYPVTEEEPTAPTTSIKSQPSPTSKKRHPRNIPRFSSIR